MGEPVAVRCPECSSIRTRKHSPGKVQCCSCGHVWQRDAQPTRRGLTEKQVALVLAAVADVEGWDGKHDSVTSHRDGTWRTMDDGIASPQPSRTLMQAVRKLEAWKRDRLVEGK